jgi:hypothetical protein
MLPTPEQERKAVLLLGIAAVLAAVGAAAFIAAFGMGLGWAARWVWGFIA